MLQYGYHPSTSYPFVKIGCKNIYFLLVILKTFSGFSNFIKYTKQKLWKPCVC